MTVLGSRAFSSAQISAVPDDDDPSRSILSRYDPDMLLYPGIDFLNHDPNTRNRWVQDGQMFGLRVYETDLKIGDEIMYSYGAKDNGQCELSFTIHISDELIAVVLLSYGFCLEDNPDDSFSLKLSPLSPNPAIESFRKTECMQGFEFIKRTTTWGKRRTSKTNARQLHVLDTSELNLLTERAASHAPSMSQNPEKHTYYLRSPSSTHADYPTGDNHLAPFPHTLLNLLSAKMMNVRECERNRVLDLESDRLHEQLCGRARMSVILLLLGRLRMELQRLGQADGIAQYAKDIVAFEHRALPRSRIQKRRLWAMTYRSGQVKLLNETVQMLEHGVAEAFRNGFSVSQLAIADWKGSLITLATGLCFVQKLLDSEEKAALNDGLEAVFGSSTDIEGWRADECEEDVWTILIGLAFTKQPGKLTGKRDHEKDNNDLNAYFMRLFIAYGLNDAPRGDPHAPMITDVEQGIINHIQQTIQVMRQRTRHTGIAENIWAEGIWTTESISTAVRVVREETLQVSLPSSAYRELRAHEMELVGVEEGGDEMEIEEMETVVALYVG